MSKEEDDDKEAIIEAIANRIKSEHRKHAASMVNWQKIAAKKIYDSFIIKTKQHEV